MWNGTSPMASLGRRGVGCVSIHEWDVTRIPHWLHEAGAPLKITSVGNLLRGQGAFANPARSSPVFVGLLIPYVVHEEE